MSIAARLGLEEESHAVPEVTQSNATTIDLTQEPAAVVTTDPEPVPATAPETTDDPTDDPAMLFVYVGSVLLLAILVLAAVLALA